MEAAFEGARIKFVPWEFGADGPQLEVCGAWGACGEGDLRARFADASLARKSCACGTLSRDAFARASRFDFYCSTLQHEKCNQWNGGDTDG